MLSAVHLVVRPTPFAEGVIATDPRPVRRGPGLEALQGQLSSDHRQAMSAHPDVDRLAFAEIRTHIQMARPPNLEALFDQYLPAWFHQTV